MKKIRPVSDLRNHFTEISETVHETMEPVILTKNGKGDMVVMSIEAYEAQSMNVEIFYKLKEAEMQAKTTCERFSHEEVFARARDLIKGGLRKNDI